MTTINELERAVKAIARGNDQITLRSVSVANPRIISDLGPLTSRMEALSTIYTAIALNYLLGEDGAKANPQANLFKMREAVRGLSESLAFSALDLTASYSKSQGALLSRCSHENVTRGLADVTKKLQPEPTTPIWASMLDILLGTALSFVPFVGPVLNAAATGGAGKLLSGLGATGTTAINTVMNVSGDASYNSTYKATTSVGDGLSQMPGATLTGATAALGTSKTTVGTWLVNVLTERDTNKAKKTLQSPETFVNNFAKVINPITQNQILNNKIFDNVRLKIDSPPIIAVAREVDRCLDKESQTVASFLDKFGEAMRLSGNMIVAVVSSSVVASFDDILKTYEDEFNAVKGSSKLSRLTPWLDCTTTNRERILALIITAYYLNPGIKGSIHSNTGVGSALMQMLRQLGVDALIDSDIKAPLFMGTGESGGSDRIDLQERNVVETFREASVVEQAFVASVKKGKDYIKEVKDSMVATINNVLFIHDNMADFPKILEFFSAASMIVNSVWKAAAAQKKLDAFFSKSFDFPINAVMSLSSQGFVKLYSTTFGTVSDKEKLFHMGGATIDSSSGTIVYSDPETATLRYYYGSFKDASDNENIMLYLFARAVTTDINLFHIFLGVVSWTDVKKKLHHLIAEINIAAHSVDLQALSVNKKALGRAK